MNTCALKVIKILERHKTCSKYQNMTFITTYLIPNDFFLILTNAAWLELDNVVEQLETEKTLRIGRRCRDQSLDDINSVIECKREAHFLGLPWEGSFDWDDHFPACFYDQDDSYKVKFNTNPHARSSNINPNYFAICKTHSRGKIFKCSLLNILRGYNI